MSVDMMNDEARGRLINDTRRWLRPQSKRHHKRKTLIKRHLSSSIILYMLIALALLILSLGAALGFQPLSKAVRKFELIAQSPKFWDLLEHDASLTKFAGGFGFTEGPVWDPAGFLYVSDEEQNQIYRVYPDGHKESMIALGDPDGNTFDAQGRLLDCASVLRAIIRVNPDGQYITLADRFQGKRFNSPNDVVVGPDRAIYFTDPTSDLPKGAKQELPFKGVFRLSGNGDVRLLAKDMSEPNGLGFSPDGKRMYVDDSEQKNIKVFDFSKGEISNERLFGDENEPGGVPDGMRLDREGNLYVTGPLGIWVWDAGGHHIGTIVVPEQPANLAWGDKDYRTLYITATTSVYRIRTKAQGLMPNLVHAQMGTGGEQ